MIHTWSGQSPEIRPDGQSADIGISDNNGEDVSVTTNSVFESSVPSQEEKKYFVTTSGYVVV